MKQFSFLLLPLLVASCAHSTSATVAAQSAAPVMPAVFDAARSAPAGAPISAGTIHLEAEKAALTAATVQTKIPGFSGSGYVGDFSSAGAKAVWIISAAHAGLYQAKIRYATPNGNKGYDLVVNGSRFSGMFADTKGAWADQSAGQVELKDGANTVSIEKGWGYYDIDSLTLTPAAAPAALKPVSAALSDPQATPQARALMASLVSLYGAKTLSGQINAGDTAYIEQVTGNTPAIMGGDFIEYSPSRLAHGSDPKNESERVIAAAKSGQVVTMLWHWNAPTDLIDNANATVNGKPVNEAWYKGFYTNATTFDVQRALADPQSADYQLLLRDIDAIAVQLEKFQAAGVPVLWRPLHEAQGGWFWWGAKGPEPFKQLWRLMHDRFINTHHLHNLIWVDCSGTDPAWYPGDKYVDIIGIDEYPADVTDPLSSTWDTLFKQYDGRKMLALTEFGGVPDTEKMHRYGVRWSYFVSWGGNLGPHKVSAAELKRLYTEPLVVTKSTLPPLRP